MKNQSPKPQTNKSSLLCILLVCLLCILNFLLDSIFFIQRWNFSVHTHVFSSVSKIPGFFLSIPSFLVLSSLSLCLTLLPLTLSVSLPWPSLPRAGSQRLFSWAMYELSSHCALSIACFLEPDVSGKDVQMWGSSLRDLPEIRDTSKSWMGWVYEEIFESNYMTCLSISGCRKLGRWPEPIKLRFYCV